MRKVARPEPVPGLQPLPEYSSGGVGGCINLLPLYSLKGGQIRAGVKGRGASAFSQHRALVPGAVRREAESRRRFFPLCEAGGRFLSKTETGPRIPRGRPGRLKRGLRGDGVLR